MHRTSDRSRSEVPLHGNQPIVNWCSRLLKTTAAACRVTRTCATCRFQKTAALNVEADCTIAAEGLDPSGNDAAAGHQRTQGGLSATGRSMRHRWPSRRGSESARIDLRCPTLSLVRGRQRIGEREAHSGTANFQHMRVNHRRRDVGMAEQILHGSNVVTAAEQGRRERVAEVCAVWRAS